MKFLKGLKDCNIYIDGKGIVRGDLSVEHGRIVRFETKEGLHLDDKYIVVPGFIDKHIHGAHGSDTMDGMFASLKNIATTIAGEGVTSFLPTTVTDRKDRIIKALNCIRDYIKLGITEGAQVLGAHLEGPFISPKHIGAQREDCILPCDVSLFREFQEASGDNIREVTFAYEENGSELCRYLRDHRIVASLGHTDAGFEDVKAAVADGASSATHIYNAMRGLHHREPGTVGGAFLFDEINCELICDFIHVNPEAIRILYKMKGGDKISLITDALECKHMPNGLYKLGRQDVYLIGKEARLEDGTLAGSALKMNEAIKNIKELLNLSLEEAVDMATINPAEVLGIHYRKGSIAIGKDADFAVIDKDLNVYLTVCMGKVVYNRLED